MGFIFKYDMYVTYLSNCRTTKSMWVQQLENLLGNKLGSNLKKIKNLVDKHIFY